MNLTSEVLIALIAQVGSLIGIVISIILTAKVKKRAENAESHAEHAANDAAVVRSETRNSHSPDQPMRHDIDHILAKLEDSAIERRSFEFRVFRRLDDHDAAFSGLKEDGANQWSAIRAQTNVANQAFDLASRALSLRGLTDLKAISERGEREGKIDL